MAKTMNWRHDVNGSFSEAAKWDPSYAGPPATGDDVSLYSDDDQQGGPQVAYTVTCDLSITLHSLIVPQTKATLSVASGVALAVGGNVVDYNYGTISIAGRLGYGGKEFQNWGTVKIADGGKLSIYGGGLQNRGLIELDSVGTKSDFLFFQDIDLTLTGGGTIKLAGSGRGVIESNGTDHTLTNQDNTIIGGGYLGNRAMTLNNQSLIASALDTAPGSLIVDTGTSTIQNSGQFIALNTDLFLESKVSNASTGFLDSYGNGTLFIDKDVDNLGHINAYKGEVALRGVTINNFAKGSLTSQSQIQGNQVTSAITLQGGTTIKGGILFSDGGLIHVLAGNSATFDGSANPVWVVGSTNLSVEDGSSLTLIGTINDYGGIDLQTASNVSSLKVQGNVTLNGSGAINLTRGQIVSNGAAAMLTSNTTIIGTGLIGDLNLKVINKSVIEAFDPNRQYALGISTNAGLDNTGGILLGVGNGVAGGDLKITSTSVQNDTGYLVGYGAGGHVDLLGALIQNGTLLGTQGGDIRVMDPGNGAPSVLQGTVKNVGALLLKTASLTVDTKATLVNNGTISGDGTVNVLGTLLNGNADNHAGNIVADQNGKTLHLVVKQSSLVNIGLMDASNGGILSIDSSIYNIHQIFALGFNSSGKPVSGSQVQIHNSTITNEYDPIVSADAIPLILGYGAGSVILLDHALITGQGTVAAVAGSEIQSKSANSSQTNSIDAGVLNSGKLTAFTPLDVTQAVTGTGTTEVDGTVLHMFSDLTGGGTAVFNANGSSAAATLWIAGASDETVSFKGAGTKTLKLDHSRNFTGRINDFTTAGARMDLVDFKSANGPVLASATYVDAYKATFLFVQAGSGSTAVVKSFMFGGQFNLGDFHTADDGSGGTMLTYSPTHASSPATSASSSSSAGSIDQLVQAMASFGAESSSTGTGAATGTASTSSPDFLSLPAAHG